MREIELLKSDPGTLGDFCGAKEEKFVDMLKSLKMPSKEVEHYRYFDMEYLLSKNYYLIDKKSSRSAENSNRLVFENGYLKEAPKEFISRSGFSAQEHFDPVYPLSHLLSCERVSLEIDRDVTLEVSHVNTLKGALGAYRISLRIKSGAKVLIKERFEGEKGSGSLILFGWDVDIQEGSLEFVTISEPKSEGAVFVGSHYIRADKESFTGYRSYALGSGTVANIALIELEKSSRCEASHLVFAMERASVANITKIVHKKSDAATRQKSRHVLKDKAQAVFDALVRVEKDAEGASVHQENRTVLLNDGAYMVAKPQLEIYIDELEASHGSTTGQIDPQELFYIRSRGIEELKAKKLIITGFVNELIQEAPKECIEEIGVAFERLFATE